MIIPRFYANPKNAISAAVMLAEIEKTTIYVHMSTYDDHRQYEYSLRTLNEVMNPDGKCIIHKQRQHHAG